MQNALASKLFGLPSFQELLIKITIDSVRDSLELSPSQLNILDEIGTDWNRLLTCGSLLAQSEESLHQDAALRIAQACLCNERTSQYQKQAAIVILHMMANKLGIELASRNLETHTDMYKDLPLPLRLDAGKRNMSYTLHSLDGKSVMLNPFQLSVYEGSSQNRYLSVSAPTSAGKSYIMMQIVHDSMIEARASGRESFCVIYLVPSRALINQASRDLKKQFLNTDDEITITSIPRKADDDENFIVYVVTQERLHWLMQEDKNIQADLLLVDEAHKVSDLTRGILLHQTIENLLRKSKGTRVIFSSPFAENPQELFKIIPEMNVEQGGVVENDYVSVNQNIILAEQIHGYPDSYKLELMMGEERKHVGEISVKHRPSKGNVLAYLAHRLGDTLGGNLVYVNGASEAERLSQVLYDLRGSDYEPDKEILEFVKLIEKVIHPKYVLGKVLKKGIAFHYGNMPQIVREGVEDLFDKGKIDYLVCTSTLLEGVNLPARSIYIRNPKRGKTNKMTEDDFRNLAGRAGRWGKEFQGNVICIEPDLWEPPSVRKKQKIVLAKDISSSQINEVIDFVDAGMPRDKNLRDKASLEHFFCYCFVHFMKEGHLPDLSINQDDLEILKEKCESIKERIAIPTYILERNPSVSPLAQQKLYERFIELYEEDESNLSDLLPAFPEDTDAYTNYIKVIARIDKYLASKHWMKPEGRAVLVIKWMSGSPLARIIAEDVKYWTQEAEEKRNMGKVIRDTMSIVEQYVRFEFAKYSSCYTDILKFALEQVGNQQLSRKVPDLNIWLELGVNRLTQVSLIELGLHRNTAIELSEIIANPEMNKEECMKWLLDYDVDMFDAPVPMIDELRRIQKEIQTKKN